MYITMLARARETQRTGALVTDLKAVEMQSKIKDIFPVEKGDWKSETGVIVRTTILDEYIQNYINQHPNACCINLGCGLDTRFYRLNQHNIFNIVGNSFRYSFGNPEIFEEMLTEILFGCYSLH